MEENFRSDMTDSLIILLLMINAELNYVFQKKGMALGKGLALVLDEDVSEEQIIQTFIENAGAVEVKSLRENKSEVRNYQMAVHRYSRFDKMDEVNTFLENRKCVTVITLSVIMPEALKEAAFTIRITKGVADEVKKPEFRDELKKVCAFIRLNPDWVVRELELSKTSTAFLNDQNGSSLFKGLIAAACIFKAIYRNSHSEEVTEQLWTSLQAEIKECVRRSEESMEKVEAVEAIRDTIIRYFDDDAEYSIGNIREVVGSMEKAIENGKAILFDPKYYFISESLFRKACEALENVLSLVEIKRILCEEGVILCNDMAARNFTVKKLYVNVFGATRRGRFIKMEKDFLISKEGLYLEERKGGASICISEK